MQKQPKQSDYFKLIYKHPEWLQYIKPDLQVLSKKQLQPRKVIQYLQKFIYYSCTHKQRQTKKQNTYPSFKGLIALYSNQIVNIIGDAAELILQYQKNPPKVPILYTQKQMQHNFNKSQILLLMSMMALSLIPNQDCKFQRRFCWYSDFSYIFSEHRYKTMTVIQYLKQQLTKFKHRLQYKGTNQDKKLSQPQQVLTIRRNITKQTLQNILHKNSDQKMCPIQITHDADSIQNYYGDIKADFANKFIGGGSLTSGCVQQQIMFANHPQLYASMLFSEMMYDNQSLFFIGFKKYFKNKGYAATTSYDGPQQIQYKYDEENRAKQYITAIDAIHFSTKYSNFQFSKQTVDRQLMKAYVGFNNGEASRVVTGNWGCGAFNGNIPLKLLIQWIACSLAHKTMVYAPFGYQNELNRYKNLFAAGQNTKIIDVYQTMIKQLDNVTPKDTILNRMQNILS